MQLITFFGGLTASYISLGDKLKLNFGAEPLLTEPFAVGFVLTHKEPLEIFLKPIFW